MEHAETAPKIEKNKKLILTIIMAFSGVVLITSLVFIARINGWLGEQDTVKLIAVIDDENVAEGGGAQKLTFIDDTFMLDSRCTDELEEMLGECRSAGYSPRIDAAYRSESEQRELFNSIVEGYTAEGYDNEAARKLAMTEADPPGFSEHQLGLAVDISDAGDDESITDWLLGNSWRYGFILRYPRGREGITGHPYVPGHFRYVGPEAAKQIYELDICLEEYVDMFYSN